MGMFDTVRCGYSGMSEEDREREYQTKDLDCALNAYEIREDGSLWCREWTEDPTEDGFAKAYVEEDITDTIVFYDYKDGKSIDYKAQWTKGKLTYFEELP